VRDLLCHTLRLLPAILGSIGPDTTLYIMSGRRTRSAARRDVPPPDPPSEEEIDQLDATEDEMPADHELDPQLLEIKQRVEAMRARVNAEVRAEASEDEELDMVDELADSEEEDELEPPPRRKTAQAAKRARAQSVAASSGAFLGCTSFLCTDLCTHHGRKARGQARKVNRPPQGSRASLDARQCVVM
jgi:hypothetical protein